MEYHYNATRIILLLLSFNLFAKKKQNYITRDRRQKKYFYLRKNNLHNIFISPFISCKLENRSNFDFYEGIISIPDYFIYQSQWKKVNSVKARIIKIKLLNYKWFSSIFRHVRKGRTSSVQLSSRILNHATSEGLIEKHVWINVHKPMRILSS